MERSHAWGQALAMLVTLLQLATPVTDAVANPCEPPSTTPAPQGLCADFSCPSGMMLRADSASILCPQAVCTDGDRNTCCEQESKARCDGFEEEYGLCVGLPECGVCIPIDCSFTDWTDWYQEAACSGLCFRNRTVARASNECGAACKGALTESKDCTHLDCKPFDVDCIIGDWEAWSVCTGPLQQRIRRRIGQYPSGRGKGCSGHMAETSPCGIPPSAVDCKLSEWDEWSSCSVTCGGGSSERHRRINPPAAYGGAPCQGSLKEAYPCNTQSCGVNVDCAFGPWSAWSNCVETSPCDALKITAKHPQRYRQRVIETPAVGDGRHCKGPVNETDQCNNTAYEDTCPLSDWREWRDCSKSCGGGERIRSRHLLRPHQRHRCLLTVLAEMEACNAMACAIPRGDPCEPVIVVNCEFAPWSPWSPCSNRCGIGAAIRNRSIGQRHSEGGKGCFGVVREVAKCSAGNPDECLPTDCVWGDWEDWSACPVSCGGGEHRRHRTIKVSPVNGGKLCDVRAKSEVAHCATDECPRPECIDGQWHPWSDWSDCSASCDRGFRSRNRRLARQASIACGRPAAGLNEEIDTCMGPEGRCIPRVDCSFNDWTDWSFCAPFCFGNKQRYREIANFSSGGGLPCRGTVQELTPCNPGIDGQIPFHCMRHRFDCLLSDWDDWSKCSATCGIGQRSRARHVSQPATSRGIPCKGSMMFSEACFLDPCPIKPCRDCRWGAWSDWGGCNNPCGGQRARRRSIAEMPNKCGQRCIARVAEETSNCTGNCSEKGFYCTWSRWSAFNPCPETGCGPHTQRRMRSLHLTSNMTCDYLAKGNQTMSCSGVQTTQRECEPVRPCIDTTPLPCKFADWGDWSAPSCDGLCSRKRVVKQNSQGDMRPCEGPLMQSKSCPNSCHRIPQDCLISGWNMWTQCTDSHSQMYRARTVLAYPKFGGKTCPGKEDLKETDNCVPKVEKVDCELMDWSEWSLCSKTCGKGGWEIRNRHIKTPGQFGGKMCNGSMEELQDCTAEMPCPDETDCLLTEWDDWTTCEHHQRFRFRDLQSPETAEGCNVALGEIAPCNQTECKISTWSDWDACDQTCGSGHQQRYRKILKPAHAGGTPCPPSLREIKGCNKGSCDPCAPENFNNCQVTAWTDWSFCNSTCGIGQQMRFRNVSQLRTPDGYGCYDGIMETRGCHSSVCCEQVNCTWEDWSVWSSCSMTCGNGSKTRTRKIAQEAAMGGKPCDPSPEEEVGPCNEKPCKTCHRVDGKWSHWSAWEPCSSPCAGGLSWRTRTVIRAANSCGNPLEGTDREYRSCNSEVPCSGDIDCVLSDWSQWSACSASCEGMTRRSRQIVTMGRGRGRSCEGALQEESSCNPAPGENASETCWGPPKVNCEYGDWSQDVCSATCGGGTYRARRSIKVPARGGGEPCNGAIVLAVPCASEVCKAPTSVPCLWSDWDDWGVCDQARGGQRKRFRHISKLPENGGSCTPGSGEETQGCTEGRTGRYCTWDQWSEWKDCSASCGNARRSRRRSLMPSDIPALPAPPNGQDSGLYILPVPPDSYICRKHHAGTGPVLQTFNHGDQLSCAQECGQMEGCLAFDYVSTEDLSWNGWSGWSSWPDLRACRLFANSTNRGDKNLQRQHCALRASKEMQQKYSSLYMETSQDEGQRPRELLIAFFGGSCSLLVVLFLVRRMTSRARLGSEGGGLFASGEGGRGAFEPL